MQPRIAFLKACRVFPTSPAPGSGADLVAALIRLLLRQLAGYRVFGCLLATCLLTTNLARAVDPPKVDPPKPSSPTVDETTVRVLVRQLASRESGTRDEAEKKLQELGPNALDYLPNIDDGMGAELKARLKRIRNHLEQARLDATTESSRLTLKGTMSLTDALDSILQQTGNEIIDYRGKIGGEQEDFEIQLDIEDEPFWPAFDKFADIAGVSLYPYVGESRKLAIITRPETARSRFGAADYEGLFRVEVTSVSCQTDLRDPQGDRMRLGIEVVWEPRVIPITLQQNLEDVEVATDNGESLALTQRGVSQIPIQRGVASLNLQVPVALPSRDAKSLSSVKGKLTAMVPGGDVRFEFDNLVDFKDSEQTRGGLTVALDDVRMNRGKPQIDVRLRFDQAGESMQSHLDWVENNKVELFDADGKSVGEPGYYERYRERDNEVGFRYVFPVKETDLTGWKLTYESPGGIAEVPIAYELKDIPLP